MTDITHEAIAAERRQLLQYVVMVRKAIAELRPEALRNHQLPSAMTEIGLIVESTENAANQIMQAVDEILEMPHEVTLAVYREAVEARCISVMEACSFQDLTGQRINKVVEMLLTLEGRIASLAELLGADDELEESMPMHANNDDALLQGPVAPGEGVDQSEIDKLFA